MEPSDTFELQDGSGYLQMIVRIIKERKE